MTKINKLTTETVNEATKNIDMLSTLEMVQVINDEDKKVAFAVEKESENIAKAIDAIALRFKQGGRLIYVGAGSSGRIGTLDAVELTPTYNVSSDQAFGILAGGEEAMYRAVEGAEDSKELAIADLKEKKINELDSIVAIAASGRTPYAIAALEYAKKVGALAVGISCNAESELASIADISIAPIVGAEVISGSTRMKAGTSQKMVVNMISTGVMVKLGKVYGNYMINVQATNEKLVQRSIHMIAAITHLNQEEAEKLFHEAGSVSNAIVMFETHCDKETAQNALKQCNDNVRVAIQSIHG